ncbi:MAG: DUF1572 family protein [Chitinophagaceae bacterium]|nr:DUF1572 family protein [Chitinophagaceae bacterium]
MGSDFLKSSIKRLGYYRELGDKTFQQLREEDFHFQPSPDSNSIAVIIRHLAGNMLSRWTDFLSTDGEKEWRNRDREFEEREQGSEELKKYWNEGWDCLMNTLQSLSEEDLFRIIRIRTEELTVVDAINRQLAHYPYHVGQIITIARIIKDKDWVSLSIPRGDSNAYNQSLKKKNS